MYSVVLMMALGTSGEVTDFGRRGCCGCCGGCYSSCCGCYGGYSSCCGCYGGYSYGCCGCYGGYSSCCGCYGGYSSCCGCYGGYSYGCGGCSSYGCGSCGYSYGCGGASYGCCGSSCGYSGCGYTTGYGTPVIITPAVPTAEPAKPVGAVNSNAAKIVVNLPTDAKLYFDGAATKATSNRREFVSPPLQAGMEYHYTLKAEVVRDGKTETQTETVTVRAGSQAQINLTFPTAAVAAK